MQQLLLALAVCVCAFLMQLGGLVNAADSRDPSASASTRDCTVQRYAPTLCKLLERDPTYVVDRRDAQDPGLNAASATYVVPCIYDQLTLSRDGPRWCLRAIASILNTEPRYGVLLMVPEEVEVSATYQRVLDTLNVSVHRVPPTQLDVKVDAIAGVRKIGVDGMNFTEVLARRFHKFRAWQLPFKRVVLIDSDSVVLGNLDHLMQSPDSVALDCSLHCCKKYKAGPRWFGVADEPEPNWHNGLWSVKFNSGLMVISPAEAKYHGLVQAVQKIVEYGKGRWPYEHADQPVLKWQRSVHFSLLPCTYQMYPDICNNAPEWFVKYYSKSALVWHYTYMHDPVTGMKMKPEPVANAETPQAQCWNYFGTALQFLDAYIEELAARAVATGGGAATAAVQTASGSS